jgi:hypothetical protein
VAMDGRGGTKSYVRVLLRRGPRTATRRRSHHGSPQEEPAPTAAWDRSQSVEGSTQRRSTINCRIRRFEEACAHFRHVFCPRARAKIGGGNRAPAAASASAAARPSQAAPKKVRAGGREGPVPLIGPCRHAAPSIFNQLDALACSRNHYLFECSVVAFCSVQCWVLPIP